MVLLRDLPMNDVVLGRTVTPTSPEGLDPRQWGTDVVTKPYPLTSESSHLSLSEGPGPTSDRPNPKGETKVDVES